MLNNLVIKKTSENSNIYRISCLSVRTVGRPHSHQHHHRVHVLDADGNMPHLHYDTCSNRQPVTTV